MCVGGLAELPARSTVRGCLQGRPCPLTEQLGCGCTCEPGRWAHACSTGAGPTRHRGHIGVPVATTGGLSVDQHLLWTCHSTATRVGWRPAGRGRSGLRTLSALPWCLHTYLLNAPLALAFPSQHRHRMVVLEPLNKLLQAKWNLLIPRFLFNFLCYLTYVSIFTAVTYHQPALDKARQGGAHPGEASWKQSWQKVAQGLQPRPANADRRPDRLAACPRRLRSWS